MGYLFGVLSCLFSPLLISEFEYPFALPVDGKSCRLNDNAPVLVAEPLQIQSLLPSRWWRIACIGSLNKFYVRTFEVLQRLIRRDVADDATLIGCDARDVIQWLGPTRNWLGSHDFEFPARQIRMAIPRQLELERFLNSLDLQPTRRPAKDRVIKLSFQNPFTWSPRHGYSWLDHEHPPIQNL